MLEDMEEKLGKKPFALQNRPEVEPEYEEHLLNFNTLSSSRAYGMGGPQPISIADMAAFCTLFGISGFEERERFVRFTQALDNAYLEAVATKTDTDSDSNVAPNP